GQSETGIIENGNIVIEKNRIVFAGNKPDLKKFLSKNRIKKYKIIDGRNKVVTPGFVDSHTHFVFAGSRENEYEMRLAGKSYQEIAEAGGGIISTVDSVRNTSEKKLRQVAEKKLEKFVRYGTTTVEGKSGYGLDKKNEIKILKILKDLNKKNKYGLDIIPTFLGAHSVPEGKSKPEYVCEICELMIPEIAFKKLAGFTDIFIEENYFDAEDADKIFSKSLEYGLIPKLHTDQFKSIGGIDVAIKFRAASVDHLEVLGTSDILKLSEYNSRQIDRKIIATLLPGVSYFLNISYQPARELIDHNIPVALATDFNPGSCMTENLQMIMSLASLKLKMNADEILNAVTINAAFALNMEDKVGSIETGKQADLNIFDIPDYKFIVYNFGVNNIEMVIKKGKIIYKAH
ncbi:MAG: imidazolonepropionase, partial [Bacteroidetes bacterium]|nr:imidazolonepropionase [Bacteroidota bacterium]